MLGDVVNETSPAAARFYHEHLRALAPVERARIAARLSLAVRQLALAGHRRRHPDASERELNVRLAVRMYGRQAAMHVLGIVPEDAW